MKRWGQCLSLLIIIVSTPAHTKAKKVADVSAVFREARYVYVEAVDGDEFHVGLAPEDRQAIADVRQALRAWNRYTLTARREDAELIFVIRKGRLAHAQVYAGVHIGARSQASSTPDQYPGQAPDRDPSQGPNREPNDGTRVGASVEGGSSDDFLFVDRFDMESGHSARIWVGSQKDGLVAPALPLLKRIEDAVEKSYPRQTASGPHTP